MDTPVISNQATTTYGFPSLPSTTPLGTALAPAFASSPAAAVSSSRSVESSGEELFCDAARLGFSEKNLSMNGFCGGGEGGGGG